MRQSSFSTLEIVGQLINKSNNDLLIFFGALKHTTQCSSFMRMEFISLSTCEISSTFGSSHSESAAHELTVNTATWQLNNFHLLIMTA